MTLMRRAAANVREMRYVSYGQGDPYAIPSNGSLANYSAAGVPVDSNTAMGLAAVWTCVRILSTTIGSMEFNTFSKKGSKLTQLAENHPLIENPFGDENGIPLPRQVGIEQMMVSKLLRGNSYNYIAARDRVGTPTMVIPLNPDVIRVDRESKSGAKIITIGGQQVDLSEIQHVMALSMPGQVTGMTPIAYLKQTIGLGLAAEEFGARFYGQGATMSGVIELSGDLDNDKARQLKERFMARHSGLHNAGAVGVLTGGATFKPISVNPNEMQFIETRAFNAAQVAAIFGVPPHLMGDTQDRGSAWGQGTEEQGIAFLTYTLKPWLTRLEESFSNMLPKGLIARFNLGDLMRTDAKSRAAVYASGRTAGWISVNEIRNSENLEPVDGGDDLQTPLNSAHNGQNDGTDLSSPKPVPAAQT